MKYFKGLLLTILPIIFLQSLGIVDFKYIGNFDKSELLKILLPMLLIVLVVNFLSGVRWIYINHLYRFKLKYSIGLHATMKSGLFVYLLPGQIGTELSRLYLINGKCSKSDTAHAISSTIVDRIIALLSQMFLLSIFLLWFCLNGKKYCFESYIPLLFLSVLIIPIFIFGNSALKYIHVSLCRFSIVDYIGNILKIVKNFIEIHPVVLILLMLYSVLLNLAIAFVLYSIVLMFNYSPSYRDIILMSQVTNISSVIPITPGGIGISEYIFQEMGDFVGIIDTAKIANCYIVFRIINILSFALGYFITGSLKFVNTND